MGLHHRRADAKANGLGMPELSTDAAVIAAGRRRSAAIEASREASRPERSASWRRISRAIVALVVVVALAAGAGTSWLSVTPLQAEFGRLVAAAIFISSYAALAIGRVPGLALDRAGIALVGAAMIVGCGALPLEDAFKSIDLDTLTLLLGMMIVVAHLRLSGCLSAGTALITRRAHPPLTLLVAITAVAGVLSAVLVNDAICLVMTPLVIELSRSTRSKPVPYLLAVAMASNIGSVATITGNPQNMMIGSLSHIPYAVFAAVLGPVAAIGLALTVGLIGLLYRRDLGRAAPFGPGLPAPTIDRILALRAIAGTAVLLVLLFVGVPPAKAAMVIAAVLLLTRRVRSERIYAEIDWSLLLMFAGLFIIIAGAERALLNGDLMAVIQHLHLGEIPVLSGLTAVLSNIVSNVPAVLLLKPIAASLPDQRSAWLTVAMASTLAGNFALLGSIANLIVVQGAAASGIRIGAWDYTKVGAPLTLLTLTLGTCWLWR